MIFTITFLGTGSSIPTARKNHTGILVQTERENILVDCGEGIQRQFKIAKLNPCKLTKILITHWHADHSLGLTGLLSTLNMSNYQKTLQIYGPMGTLQKIRLLEEVYGRFKISFKVHELSNGSFETPELIIESAEMTHLIPTIAYSLAIKDKIRLDKTKIKKYGLPNSPILKDLQKGKDIVYKNKKYKAKNITYVEKGKKISIVLDTSENKNTLKIAKNSDLLICESTYSCEEKAKAAEYKHLTTKQAAEIAKKSKVKKLIITHLSQKHERNEKSLLDEAKNIFPNTHLAKDLETLVV